jgi:WD40 repeat protein/tRNA A-37 threonylcarbamoyl transferase component Bud32
MSTACAQCGGRISSPDGFCSDCLKRVALQESELVEEAAAGEVNDLLPGPLQRKSGSGAGGSGGFGRTNGESWGDYQLLEPIGRGAMGTVFKARQVRLNRLVALKRINHGRRASAQERLRFLREAEAAARLQHPHIVTLYETGEVEGQPYLAMEYVPGKTLAETIAANPLPPREAARCLKKISDAVQYAHEHGVLHRDLKPSNVALDLNLEPRVMDFGLARLMEQDSEMTLSGMAIGSPSYMAPEQAAGRMREVSAASDVYSLGAILYETLTARPPFRAESSVETMRQVLEKEPVSPRLLNASVPRDLETICLKCLQKEPRRRYATAQELAEDLNRFLCDEPIRARAVRPIEKVWLWCKRRPVLAVMGVALHLAIALGIAGVLWQWQRAEQNAHGERQQRRMAEDYAARVRMNLYAGDVSFAAHALQRGNLGVTRRTLAALRPQPSEVDLRGFEWRYLWNHCQGDQLAVLGSHERTITCAAFSPDGKLLATGSQDQTVKIWDVAQRALVRTLNAATGTVWSVGFTPDSRQLITSGVGGVRLWDGNSWQTLTNYPGQVASLARNRPLLATAAESIFHWWQPPGAVSVWNYQTGEKVLELPKPGRVLAFSPDGGTLAVARQDRGVDLWDVATGTMRETLSTTNGVRSLAFSHEGGQLLVIRRASPPMLFDLAAPFAPRSLVGHPMEVWTGDFSPDDVTIATVSSDQTLRIWNTASLETEQILRGHQHEVWCVAFSPDGKTLATGGKDQQVMLWSRASRPAITTMPNQKDTAPFFSPDGKQIVTLGTPGSPASSAMRDLAEGSTVSAIPGRRTMGFAADGRQLVRWGRDNRSLEFISPGATNITSVALGGFDEHSRGVQYQGFTPDWRTFFAIDDLGCVRIWAVATGTILKSIQGPPPPISAGALSPNGKILALGAQKESVVHCYDLTTGHETQLAGHKDTVRGLAFSPDGVTLASGSLDGAIRLWNPGTGECLAELPGHMEETSDVAFSPDGRTLASVNVRHTIKLWHVATQRELVSWDFPQAGQYVRFSPDGRFLAVTTQTNSIHLFEAPPL